MNQELKPFIVKFGIVAGSIVGVGGLIYATSCYQEYTKVEKHNKSQQAIREMIAYCDFNKLSDDEEKKIKDCGDDVESARLVLCSIVKDRIIFWKGRLANASEALDKLQALRRGASYWDRELEVKYTDAVEKVKSAGREAIQQLEVWNGKFKGLNDWKSNPANKSNLVIENIPTKPSGTSA